MILRNTPLQYGFVAKAFHWLIAVLVIIMILVGTSFSFISYGSFKMQVLWLHKSIGVTILILMILRLIWRLLNPIPPLPATVKTWQRIASRTVHALLYITVIAMPLSGILMSLFAGYSVPFWGLFTLSGVTRNPAIASFMHSAHTTLAWVITGLIILHFLAAMKHHFIDKDIVLRRML